MDATLIAGGGGIFDVKVNDDRLVYSKFETGRFPEKGEVVKLLQEEG